MYRTQTTSVDTQMKSSKTIDILDHATIEDKELFRIE